jgi:multisubunit Na+/H+ antiporter MnhB subunit
MNKPLHILRPAALIIIGLLLALLSAAVGQPVGGLTGAAGTSSFALQVTVTPPPGGQSEIGSTDGLVFISVMIAAIILTPIFLRWKLWVRKP